MRRHILNILKTFAGIISGAIVVAFMQEIGLSLWPHPHTIQNAGADPTKMREAVAQIPFGAKLFVVIAWTAGSFTGGLVTGLLNGYPKQVRWVGVLMLSIILLTLMTFPHPLWMAASSVLLPMPAAYTGGRLGKKWAIATKHMFIS